MAQEKTYSLNIDTGKSTQNLNNLNNTLNKTDKECGSLKEQLRQLNVQMAEHLAKGGSDVDKAFLDMAKQAGHLKDAISDANAAVMRFASDTKRLDDVVGVMSLVGNSIQLVQGAANALGVENENLVRSIQKLQGITAVVNSLKSIQTQLMQQGTLVNNLYRGIGKTLKETSAAFTVAGGGMSGAAASLKTFGAATTAALGPIGLLVIALGSVAIALKKMNDRGKEAFEALKKPIDDALDASKKFAESWASSAAKSIVNFQSLRKEWINLKTQAEKTKWIAENTKQFNALNISIKNTNDAEKVFNQQADQYVDAMKKRAQATASFNLAVKAMEAELTANQSDLAIGAQINAIQSQITTLQATNKTRYITTGGGVGGTQTVAGGTNDVKIADLTKILNNLKDEQQKSRRDAQKAAKESDKYLNQSIKLDTESNKYLKTIADNTSPSKNKTADKVTQKEDNIIKNFETSFDKTFKANFKEFSDKILENAGSNQFSAREIYKDIVDSLKGIMDDGEREKKYGVYLSSEIAKFINKLAESAEFAQKALYEEQSEEYKKQLGQAGEDYNKLISEISKKQKDEFDKIYAKFPELVTEFSKQLFDLDQGKTISVKASTDEEKEALKDLLFIHNWYTKELKRRTEEHNIKYKDLNKKAEESHEKAVEIDKKFLQKLQDNLPQFDKLGIELDDARKKLKEIFTSFSDTISDASNEFSKAWQELQETQATVKMTHKVKGAEIISDTVSSLPSGLNANLRSAGANISDIYGLDEYQQRLLASGVELATQISDFTADIFSAQLEQAQAFLEQVDTLYQAAVEKTDESNERMKSLQDQINAASQDQIATLKEELATEQMVYLERQRLEAQRLKDKQKAEAKIKEIEKKSKRAEIFGNLASAIANIATGITAALKQGIAGMVTIPIISAAGAIQTATIATQLAQVSKMEKGGLLSGPRHSEGGIKAGGVEMEGGEYVVNRRATKRYLPLLEEVNAWGNTGKGDGKKFANGGIFTLQNLASTSTWNDRKIVEAIARMQPVVAVTDITKVQNRVAVVDRLA